MVRGSMKPFCVRGHKRTPDTVYKNGTCKECNKALAKGWQERNPELSASLSAEWRQHNPSAYRDALLKSRYSVSPSFIDNLLSKQGGRCAICRVQFSDELRPHVDHDHNHCPVGKGCERCIRGLLCRECNLGLGHFKDSPEALDAAKAYVQKHSLGGV